MHKFARIYYPDGCFYALNFLLNFYENYLRIMKSDAILHVIKNLFIIEARLSLSTESSTFIFLEPLTMLF